MRTTARPLQGASGTTDARQKWCYIGQESTLVATTSYLLVCLELSQSAVLFILKVKNILKYTSMHGEVTLSGKVIVDRSVVFHLG